MDIAAIISRQTTISRILIISSMIIMQITTADLITITVADAAAETIVSICAVSYGAQILAANVWEEIFAHASKSESGCNRRIIHGACRYMPYIKRCY